MDRRGWYLSAICKNKKAAQKAAFAAIRISTELLRPASDMLPNASEPHSLTLQRRTDQLGFLNRLSGHVRYTGMPPQLSRMAIEIFINIVFPTLFQLNNIPDITHSNPQLPRPYSHPKKSDQTIHYHQPTTSCNHPPCHPSSVPCAPVHGFHNLQPSTLNPQPSILNPQSSAISTEPPVKPPPQSQRVDRCPGDSSPHHSAPAGCARRSVVGCV